MSSYNPGDPSIHDTIDEMLIAFEMAHPEERQAMKERLLQLLPVQGVADRGLHFEATLHAPQLSHRLEAIREAKHKAARALTRLDAHDEARVRTMVAALRERERQESDLLAEMWYAEVGGEG